MYSIIICIISCLLQNFHLFVSSRTMRTLPGPMRLPFIGSTFSVLLQKPEGNNNNNNNNNNNSSSSSSSNNNNNNNNNNIVIHLINKEL